MPSLTRLAAAALFALLITGCATWTMRNDFERRGLKRASFELECPEEQLKLVALNGKLDGPPYHGSQVGVTGCGKRAVYVSTKGEGWLLDSAGEKAQAADQP